MLPCGGLNRLRELSIGRQRPVDVAVGAQNVGQHHRIGVFGFTAGLPVPLAVPSHCARIDRKHGQPGPNQGSYQQPFVRLDRDLNRGRPTLTVLG